MTDHKALIAEARTPEFESAADEAWGRNGSSPADRSDLVRRLADALEAASVERAVVEAQALEQAAWRAGIELPASTPQEVEAWLRARAVEIREGRQ